MKTGILGGRRLRRGTAARRRIDRLTATLVEQCKEHPDAEEYVRFQWGERVLLAHVVSRRAKEAFYTARWLVVIGATVVPTLVAVGFRTHGTVAMVTQIAAVVLSLLVAVAAGAVQVQMGQRWRLFQQLEVELEHAGWQLFARRGEYAYADGSQRFGTFVDRVEAIVIAYQTGYGGQMARLDRDDRISDSSASPAASPSPLTPDWDWP
jgi:hypothetical protein